ncbi:MAG: chemotaxis protein CheD [Anaerolineaceae bacterium]|nr:chemotaxis protein CheD [Anaerolineaceae bacterium]
MLNNIAVGLGEIKISDDPNTVLVAFGLGSCVGVGIFDPVKGVGGMLHAVLPSSSSNKNQDTASKYVDSGIQMLISELEKLGLDKKRSKLYVIGGANILMANKDSAPFDIGTRNVKAAKAMFEKITWTPDVIETGGHNGRTFRLYIEEGRATIRTMGEKEKDI